MKGRQEEEGGAEEMEVEQGKTAAAAEGEGNAPLGSLRKQEQARQAAEGEGEA